MTGEESLSLEETNRLRLSLGLKPIPVEDSSTKETTSSPSGKGGESISLEETNRIRIENGLKPIPVPESGTEVVSQNASISVDDEEKLAKENWARYNEQEEAKKRAVETSRREEKAKELAERNKVLHGRVLGEASDDEPSSARDWIKSLKRKRKADSSTGNEKLATNRALTDYTESDLQGVKVGHDMQDFAGEETILTLQDRPILDEDDDELAADVLESRELVEKKKLQENLDSKRKKGRYTNYDDEFSENEEGDARSREILGHYNDELYGKKTKSFVIKGEDEPQDSQTIKRESPGARVVPSSVNKMLLFDDNETHDSREISTDYLQMKVRKPKKRKNKSSRSRFDRLDDSEEVPGDTEMNVENDISLTTPDMEDDLNSFLSSHRRKVQQKRRKILKTPEMLAADIEKQRINGETIMEIPHEDRGLVIDATSSFVDSLGNQPVEEEEVAAYSKSTEENEDIPESREREPRSPEEESSARTSTEAISGLEEVTRETKSESPSLGEDQTLNGGMGSTLSILRSRGILKPATPEGEDERRQQREHLAWVERRRKRMAEVEQEIRLQRERDRMSGKYDKLTQREREEQARRENAKRQAAEAKLAQRMFEDYKPNIKLEYKDDEGRELSTKEAFKHMSHQFHGKGSGAAKTEKRLKKIEEDQRKMRVSSLGNVEGYSSSLSEATKTSKKAGVRLQ